MIKYFLKHLVLVFRIHILKKPFNRKAQVFNPEPFIFERYFRYGLFIEYLVPMQFTSELIDFGICANVDVL